MCVCERERERESECVCVCVCVKRGDGVCMGRGMILVRFRMNDV